MEPNEVFKGEGVRFLKSHTFNDKKRGEKIKAESGESGEVIWCGAFGQFYSNGYNKPSRFNRRVGVKLEDGRVVFCPLEKLRYDREPKSDSELESTAERLSYDAQFGKALHPKHAWDTTNHAFEVLSRNRD